MFILQRGSILAERVTKLAHTPLSKFLAYQYDTLMRPLPLYYHGRYEADLVKLEGENVRD